MGQLDDISAKLDEVLALLKARPAAATAPRLASGGGAVFPNYGKAKGQPVAGASVNDLEYYANGCRRTLDDPAKAKWHDKERALLAAIEAELGRGGKVQEVGGVAFGPSTPAPPDDDSIPF